MDDQSQLSLLLVEDETTDANAILRLVRGFRDSTPIVKRVSYLREAMQFAAIGAVDACLLDLTLPDVSGIDTVVQFLSKAPMLPVIVLTGHDDMTIARQAVAYGAQDYLVKGSIRPRQMELVIATAIERKRCTLVGERLTHAALAGFEAEGRDSATVSMIRDAVAELIAADQEKMRYLLNNAPQHIRALQLIAETRDIPTITRFVQETLQIGDQRHTPVGGTRASLVADAARASVTRVQDRATARATRPDRITPTDPPEATRALLDIIERRGKS